MSQTPIFELKDVTFRYSNRSNPVLDDFSLVFNENQRLGLIGPNGSGKTTLFHIVMGLLSPESGSLIFKGSPVQSKEDFRTLRKDIGLLFQDADDQLFSPTVIEDVAFGPLNLGATPAEARLKALKTLDRLGMGNFAERITHQLSGGEKKLISLATILVMDPKALLLDEPTNNLDPETRHKLITILRELDLGYIIISHDWDFLSDTCKDVYTMYRGKAVQCDKSHLHSHSHAHPYGGHPHQHYNE